MSKGSGWVSLGPVPLSTCDENNLIDLAVCVFGHKLISSSTLGCASCVLIPNGKCSITFESNRTERRSHEIIEILSTKFVSVWRLPFRSARASPVGTIEVFFQPKFVAVNYARLEATLCIVSTCLSLFLSNRHLTNGLISQSPSMKYYRSKSALEIFSDKTDSLPKQTNGICRKPFDKYTQLPAGNEPEMSSNRTHLS